MNNITDNKYVLILDSEIEYIQEMPVYQESKAFEFKKYVSGLYIDVLTKISLLKELMQFLKKYSRSCISRHCVFLS